MFPKLSNNCCQIASHRPLGQPGFEPIGWPVMGVKGLVTSKKDSDKHCQVKLKLESLTRIYV